MKYLRLNPLAFSLLVWCMSKEAVCCQCPGNKATVLTYNTGLSASVPFYQERRLPVIKAIAQIAEQVDFMCLQEMWYEEDMQEVIQRVEETFPYHYSPLHFAVGQLGEETDVGDPSLPGNETLPCSPDLFGTLLTCVQQNCLGASDLRTCVLERCRLELYGVSQDCRSCIAITPFSDVPQFCANSQLRFNRFNKPGLLVLSRKPLSSAEYINFLEGEKVLIERGYISAQVGSHPKYICTHLSANFPVYYELALPQFSSFREQQAAEMTALSDTFSGSTHVLLGDINAGPARNQGGAPLNPEVAENYQTLISRGGYINPYLAQEGSCTYCQSTNPVLKDSGQKPGDLAIDHILTSNVQSQNAKRVLDSSSKKLSDHYGVQLDVCLL